MSTENSDTEQHDAAAREAVRDLRQTITQAHDDTMRLVLTEARTHYGWQDKPVSEATLRTIYDHAKMGPTSMNQQPIRLVFVQSETAKKTLEPALMEANRPKMMAAPVTAIIGYDSRFFEKLPEVFPVNPKAKAMFEANPEMAATNAFRNGTLQAAFLIIAARAEGLDAGPMSGFDNAAVDAAFFAGTSIKSNFLCNLGYADESKIFRQLPRLPFDDVAKIV